MFSPDVFKCSFRNWHVTPEMESEAERGHTPNIHATWSQNQKKKCMFSIQKTQNQLSILISFSMEFL